MKTAVEWLYQHLFPKQLDGFSEEEWSKIDAAFKQAKEMEKEQMIDAWENGKKSTQCKTPICRMKTGIGYYNKTFKQEQ
jgi:hypothetical protein